MKYLYKGMAAVEEGGNCSVLLNWHEKVRVHRLSPQSYKGLMNALVGSQLTEVAGVGCIVRTMADRRIV